MELSALQQQQINMHFGAIDPVQFESAKLFDQNIGANNLMDSTHTNYSEVALAAAASANNNPILPAPSQAIAQPTFDTFQYFNQTIPQAANAFTGISQIQPNQETAQIQAAADLAQIEQRNHELTNLLHVEKVRNNELSIRVTQQHSRIEELSQELQQLRQNGGSIQEMQQQVNAHVQTVNILVGEKSDLTAKLQHKDQRLTEYESQCVELQGRLNASRHRVSELEKDLNTLTQSHQKYDGSQQALCTELETLQEENKRWKRLHQEACDENTEIQHQLAAKSKEMDELRYVIDSKASELEMIRVRLETLNGGDLTQSNETPAINQNQQDQRLLDTERQIIELQNMISELTNDRDRTQQQYQTYVQHLTNETTTMTQRIQDLTKANEKLTKREESLVHHVQELEKQIQKQLSTQRRLAALRDEDKPKTDETNHVDSPQSNEEFTKLKEKLNAIEKEKADLNVS